MDALRAVDDAKESQKQLEKESAKDPGISSVAGAPSPVKSVGKSMAGKRKIACPEDRRGRWKFETSQSIGKFRQAR